MARVPHPELEENHGQLLGRVGEPAVLPVDDTEAVVGAEDAVRPQVAVAGLQARRRFQRALHGHQFVAIGGELVTEGRCRRGEGGDQVVPGGGADRFGVPRVDRDPGVVAHAVDGGDDRPHRHRIDHRVVPGEVEPTEHPDRLAGDVGEDVPGGGADHHRHVDPGGPGGLLVARRPFRLGNVGKPEVTLDRPRTILRLQPPDLALLASGNRPVQREGASQPVAVGDGPGLRRSEPGPRRRHEGRAVASSSAAWPRPRSLSGMPASIRASSSTRPAWSSRRTSVTVPVRSTT